MLLLACNDEPPDSVPVIWSDLTVSADRRTIKVVTSSPVAGVGCAKSPGGVNVTVGEDDGVAYIDARMTRDAPPEGVCTLECGSVEQTVTLAEPLPVNVSRFEPVGDAVPGCLGALPVLPTTTTIAAGATSNPPGG